MNEIEKDELVARLDDDTLAILDVRSVLGAHRRRRRAVRPAAGADPRVAAPAARRAACSSTGHELRERLGLPAGAEIAAYCHSGSRSAIATQILRGAGYDARNYVGSWHEWSRDESLPAETGEL